MRERQPCVDILANRHTGAVAAIRREKSLKKWRRDRKRNLIERQNPEWNDLAVALGLELQMHRPAARWTPEQVRGDEMLKRRPKHLPRPPFMIQA